MLQAVMGKVPTTCRVAEVATAVHRRSRPEAILAARVGLKRAVSSAIVLIARGGPSRRRRWFPTTCRCRLIQKKKKKKKKKRKGREVRNSTCPSPTSMVKTTASPAWPPGARWGEGAVGQGGGEEYRL